MSAGFLIKEGFSGLTRAKTPSFVAIATIAISLTLLGGAYEIGSEVYDIFVRMQSRFEMEVFLLPSVTEHDKSEVEQRLENHPQVTSIHYVSKEEAARRFSKEFGEDLSEVLDYNPLPSSYRIRLDTRSISFSQITSLAESLEKQGGVDEVKYRRQLLGTLQQYYTIFLAVGGIILLVVLGAAVFLISNTIKLSIFAKREVIEIMRLVGATDRFVKTPFVIEGVVHGAIGALIASVLLLVIIRGTNFLLTGIVNTGIDMEIWLVPAFLGVGMMFGFIGSMRSVRLFLDRTR